MVTFMSSCEKFFEFWRSLPFGASAALLLSLFTWFIAHRKIDDVVYGLYEEWKGANETRDKIAILDLPYAIVNTLNLAAVLLSFSVVGKTCQRSASGLLKSLPTKIRVCLPSIVWISCFGIVSFLLLLSTVAALFLSQFMLIIYVILTVLSVFCMLPRGLLPEADNIIDNLNHPITAGLDLVKFCPEHHAVNEDAFDLLISAIVLTLAQAGMLACITSSMEDCIHLLGDDEISDDSDAVELIES